MITEKNVFSSFGINSTYCIFNPCFVYNVGDEQQIPFPRENPGQFQKISGKPR